MLTLKIVSQRMVIILSCSNVDTNIYIAKERVQRELQLLHARKQAIDLKKKPTSTTATSIHKVKKGGVKKVSSSKKQKKIAKALAIADKEEKRLETAAEKARKRKMGKSAW